MALLHGFPLKFIPANFYLESLVALELKYNNLILLWKEAKLLEKLKILNLSHSHHLEQSPDFSNMPNLGKADTDCSLGI
ncbi:hypothetical protein L6164_002943 [Bauhinia variegata]|uniref:Uncharacterized protein n=1 Tax=Bauhinia variegata TaxID=167791 RepID=A0ACB9PZV2_BAUVA|nr:hypothetical protein L6164_002943 [Bauhinia variegata]